MILVRFSSHAQQRAALRHLREFQVNKLIDVSSEYAFAITKFSKKHYNRHYDYYVKTNENEYRSLLCVDRYNRTCTTVMSSGPVVDMMYNFYYQSLERQYYVK